MKNNQLRRYSAVIKGFHWVIALLVIGMLSMGFFLDDLPKAYQSTAVMVHKSTGILILTLMFLRMLWVAWKGRIPLPKAMPAWEVLFSRIVQYSLYCFVLMQPLTGWIMSTAAGKAPHFFGLFTLPFPGIPHNKSLSNALFEVHVVVAWILITLIAVHIAGALKHHYWDKDDVLRAMLPGKK